MDIKSLAIKLISEKFGSSDDQAGSALSSLMGGGDFDIAGLVSKFSGGSLGGMLQSWLGDGDNESVQGSQIADVFGGDKLGEFASKLGIDNDNAASGLADVIPNLIDKSSSGGDLLGNLGGLAGMASKLFGK